MQRCQQGIDVFYHLADANIVIEKGIIKGGAITLEKALLLLGGDF